MSVRFDIEEGYEDTFKIYNGFKVTSLYGSHSLIFSGAPLTYFSPTIENGYVADTNTNDKTLLFRDLVVSNNAGSIDLELRYVDWTNWDTMTQLPEQHYFNLDVGTSARVGYNYETYLASFFKDINVEVKDTNSNFLEDVIVFVENTNGDVFYNYTNSNGVLNEDLEVLYAVFDSNNKVPIWKRYTKGNSQSDYNNNEDDLLDIHFISYNHLINQLEGSMKNIGTLTLSNLMFIDTSITELDKSVVENYNGIDINHNLKEITITQNYDLNNLYDYLKYDKLNNLYNSNYEVGELFFSGDGTTLNLGDYNLIVDSTTLSQSDKFEKIVTSGEIQNLNNAVLDFSYEDLNGDSALYFSTDWKLFYNIDDAKNSSITPIASGTPNDIYRFFKPENSQYRVAELYQNGVYQYVEIDLSNGFQTIDISLEGSVEDINTKVDQVLQNQEDHTSSLLIIDDIVTDTNNDVREINTTTVEHKNSFDNWSVSVKALILAILGGD